MPKNKKNKNKGSATTTTKSKSTEAVVDKDQVKDTGSNKASKREPINLSGAILELKGSLEKAGFKQTEVKAQKFVFEMTRGDTSHRICSLNHAKSDSRRKVFTVIIGVPSGLDAKTRPYLNFSERGAATSGSKPAFTIRVDRHSLDEHWNGDIASMIKDVVSTVQEASKLRGALMAEAAKAAKSKSSKKQDTAEPAAEAEAEAEVDDEGEAEAEDEPVETSDKDLDDSELDED